jgi:hypothetical protein
MKRMVTVIGVAALLGLMLLPGVVPAAETADSQVMGEVTAQMMNPGGPNSGNWGMPGFPDDQTGWDDMWDWMRWMMGWMWGWQGQ